MNPIPYEQQYEISRQFDAFTKRLLSRAAIDYDRATYNRRTHEIVFSELSEGRVEAVTAADPFDPFAERFSVMGYGVDVSNEQLAEALQKLPPEHRDIVLLAYCLEMNDREIADRLNLVRRTVTNRRNSALEQLRKLMKGSKDYE